MLPLHPTKDKKISLQVEKVNDENSRLTTNTGVEAGLTNLYSFLIAGFGCSKTGWTDLALTGASFSAPCGPRT